VRRLVERLDERTAHTVEQRLATLLLTRHADARGRPFTLAGTQAEAAEELGTVREVLVRTLRRLCTPGCSTTRRAGTTRVASGIGAVRLAVAGCRPY
jgi:hypothetical protein